MSKMLILNEHDVEQLTNSGGFAAEVMLERVQAACMRLISIRERPVTLRAFPQRALIAHHNNVIKNGRGAGGVAAVVGDVGDVDGVVEGAAGGGKIKRPPNTAIS